MTTSIIKFFSLKHHCSAMTASMTKTKQNQNYLISYKRKLKYSPGHNTKDNFEKMLRASNFCRSLLTSHLFVHTFTVYINLASLFWETLMKKV